MDAAAIGDSVRRYARESAVAQGDAPEVGTSACVVVCAAPLPDDLQRGVAAWSAVDALAAPADPRPLVAAGVGTAGPVRLPHGGLVSLSVALARPDDVSDEQVCAVAFAEDGSSLLQLFTRLRDMQRSQAVLRQSVPGSVSGFDVFWPAATARPFAAPVAGRMARAAAHDAFHLPPVATLHRHAALLPNAALWLRRPGGDVTGSASTLATALAARSTLPPRPYGHLVVSPHEKLELPPARDDIVPGPETVRAVVQGPYAYFHYLCDGFDDRGFGCAYRSMQTVLSWFLLNNAGAPFEIPDVRGIQLLLTRIDSAVHKPALVGSKKWIGSIEVQLATQHFLGPDLDCRILRAESGVDFAENPTFIRQIVDHFREGGGPGTIGGASMAFTLLGVHANPFTLAVEYLILDPHYPSTTTDLTTVKAKRWLAWQDPRKFFDKGRDYNVCLPIAASLI